MFKLTNLVLVTLCLLAFACTEQSDLSDIDQPESSSGIEGIEYKPWDPINMTCSFKVIHGWGPLCIGNTEEVCRLEMFCRPKYINVCDIIKCPEVWEIRVDPFDLVHELNLHELQSLKDIPELGIGPIPVPITVGVPFALNESILGFQFYSSEALPMEMEGNFGVVTLPNDLVLDEEMAFELGLYGQVIPAGDYPVVANEEAGNWNLITAVAEGF